MTIPLRLCTERLILRPPAPADWEPFRAFMMSDRAEGFGSHRHEGRAFRAFAAELGHWQIFGYGMWAVTRRGEDRAVALVGPWTPPDWPEPEVGWMVLDAAAEGTGIAREATEAAIAHAYGTLGWRTVVSYIAEGNRRSEALARRLGARPDPDAPAPEGPEGRRIVVWRHPQPEQPR